MRSLTQSLIVTVLTCAPSTLAQVSLEMSPIEANSSITDITLYRGRAAVTRTTTLDVSTGGYSIFFRDLPNTIHLDSVQASVMGDAKLLSIDTSNTPVVQNNSEQIKEILEQIKALKSLNSNAEATLASIDLQVSLVESLIERSNKDTNNDVDLEALQEQIKFIGSTTSNLLVERIAITKNVSENYDKIDMLERKLNNLGSRNKTQLNAVVDIGVMSNGKVTVELTYLVDNANWTPEYSIRANTTGDMVTIEYDAEITQKTGENWTDVNVTLSTAQPQRSTAPPMPKPWYVDIYQPPPPSAPADNKRGSRSAYGMESDGNIIGVRMLDSQIMESRVAEASMAATVNNDGPAISFSLPRTITVPSNAADKQTTSLGAFETEATLYRIATPMITDSTFMQSEVTNTSEYILLPGRASIFHGSDYVGKTTLQTITPNETFTVNLGIDPSVVVTRILLEKETTSTGLFSSGVQTNYEYQASISSGHSEPIELQIWDRIPISRNEEIEVSLNNLSMPLSTAKEYLASKRPQGLLRWDLTIAPERTGNNSEVLSWEVEVAHSEKVDITSLPE